MTLERLDRAAQSLRRGALAPAAAVVIAASAPAPLALAQQEAPAEEQRHTLFVLERAAAAEFLSSPKDRALASALGMLPARLKELPQQVPDLRELPLPLLETILDGLAAPARIAMRFNPQDQSGGLFGAGVVVSLDQNGEPAARQFDRQITSILEMGEMAFQPQPSKTYAGMSEFWAPMMQVRYGPRRTDDGWTYELHVGSVGNPDSIEAALPEVPAGTKVLARATVDLAAAGPLLQWVEAIIPEPQTQELIGQLLESGAFSTNAIRLTTVFGRQNDSASAWSILENVRSYADQLGVATEPITEDGFRAVPSDAWAAGVSRVAWERTVGVLRTAISTNPDAQRAFGEFARVTGVDPLNDLLGAMDGTIAAYLSDSTGGGGPASLTIAASLRDSERFAGAIDRLVSFGNEMIAAEAEGPVQPRLRRWRDGDIALTSLSFPGMPIPLEPTIAVAGNWVVLGATPQAALAGSRQAVGRGDEGLRAAPPLKGLPPNVRYTTVSFIDASRAMRGGYPAVSLVGSAVANFVRGSGDDAREPGLAVPLYGDLARGAQPIVSYSYWDDQDLISYTRLDQSVLVNIATVSGLINEFSPLIAAAAVGAQEQQRREHLGHRLQELEQLERDRMHHGDPMHHEGDDREHHGGMHGGMHGAD